MVEFESPTDLPDDLLVERIKMAHKACLGVGRLRWYYYFYTGELLLELRRRTPHGQLAKRIAELFDFTDRTARTYMKLAEHRALLEPLAHGKRKENSGLSVSKALRVLRAHKARSASTGASSRDSAVAAPSGDHPATVSAASDEKGEENEPIDQPTVPEARNVAESAGSEDEPNEEPDQDGAQYQRVDAPGLRDEEMVNKPTGPLTPRPDRQNKTTDTRGKALTRLSKRFEADYQQVDETLRDVKVHDLTSDQAQLIRNLIKRLELTRERLELVLVGEASS
jgi:hypothetical protein